ncbi:MAG: Exodeoxyribonuclease [Myxococcaceae bacterium]|nr:Exodeoxyribonuclease [Myxococcaceae bacterium]
MIEIVSWNVERLARHLSDTAPPLRDIVRALGQPAIFCLQELALRPIDHELVARMTAALPGYACHFSLCRDSANATFRGGRMYGVATYVAESLHPSAPRTFAWDREGRVVVTELPDDKLAIVNVYAVNGTSKPYFDHDRGHVVGDRHAWKRRFIELLASECQALKARGLHLVLVGDWNVSRAKIDVHPRLRVEEPHALARAAFNDVFLPSLDVVDIFRHLHPTERKYTWFSRRVRPPKLDAARVDFALVSEALVPRVVVADIHDAEEQRHGSDHAPLFVRLRSEE